MSRFTRFSGGKIWFDVKDLTFVVWRENRVTHQNLKVNTDDNVNQDDIDQLWLPRIVYWNTDQEEKELGMKNNSIDHTRRKFHNKFSV